jgi:hypothetical protein
VETQRFPFSRGFQLVGFVILAAAAVVLLVVGVTADESGLLVTALVVAAVMGALAAFVGRQALGPAQSYEVTPEGLIHVRGSEEVLFVPWEQVASARHSKIGGRYGTNMLMVYVRDMDAIDGGHAYRNTKKLIGANIALNTTLLRSEEAFLAAVRDRLGSRLA